MSVSGPRVVSGQSLPEFALILPVFLLLVFGIIQFGLIGAGQNALVNGVREAARYASTRRVATRQDAIVACSSAAIQGRLDSALSGAGSGGILPGYDNTRLSTVITYSWILNPDAASYYVQLRVSATYKFPLFPYTSFLSNHADSRMWLSASEQMRIENNPLNFASAPSPVTTPLCT